jgi:hypothetical protein
MCKLVWQRYRESGKLPYGFRLGNTHFDAEGRLVLGARARGLTCATLLVAVFRRVGIELIDENTWPVRTAEDLTELAGISSAFEATVYEVLRMELTSGCIRIRPEEVVASCACALPAAFSKCLAERPHIIAILEVLGPQL